jgi:FMN reductase
MEADVRVCNRMSELPYIVAIGGTTRPNSSTEKALRVALAAVERLDATTCLLCGGALDLPMYAPERPERVPAATRLIDEIRSADGLILASPAYHGSVSGLIKNAIEYVEDLSKDAFPYLEGRPVGIIATGAGWQGAVQTVVSLRGIVHALRGWPTPLGVAVNTAEPVFDADGRCIAAKVNSQLESLARDVVSFARSRRGTAAPAP